MRVLILCCLSLSLISCGPLMIRPSTALTRDCDRPTLDGNTYRDVVVLAVEQDKALAECTDRMRAIR